MALPWVVMTPHPPPPPRHNYTTQVGRCMGNRMQALSEFLGGKEPVKLGGDMMNLDTSYVLYECLARNYQSVVPVEPDHMNALAIDILQRSGGSADKLLAKKMISGDAWALFEAVMQRYILILVEVRCAPRCFLFRLRFPFMLATWRCAPSWL